MYCSTRVSDVNIMKNNNYLGALLKFKERNEMHDFEINKNGTIIRYDYQYGEYFYDSTILDLEKIVPISMCWLIEENCNLDCIYCYSSHKSMNSIDAFYQKTVDNVLSLNPVSIVLTGGEPTLNKNLISILQYIDGRIVTIIDSNGTTNVWESIIPFMKNAVVRISVDSINPKILEAVRPAKKMSSYFVLSKITENIDMLVKNKIPIIVQTVLTSYNIDCLDELFLFLMKHKVPRWYISCVKRPNNDSFSIDNISASFDSLEKLKEKIIFWNKKGVITTLSQELEEGKEARLFIEKGGKFYIDTLRNGKQYIGANPHNPTIEEIVEAIDVNKHYDLYLKRSNLL